VPPVAAILVAQNVWNPKTIVNDEELNPDPFLKLLNRMGLPTEIEDRTPVGKTA